MAHNDSLNPKNSGFAHSPWLRRASKVGKMLLWDSSVVAL